MYIGNAYLYAPTSEKLWTKEGIEFGEEGLGKIMIKLGKIWFKGSGDDYRKVFAT